MRSTIRVFIKTELKKRETSRAKQTKDATPATPSTPVEAPAASAATGESQAQIAADGVAAISVGETQTQSQTQTQTQGDGSSSSSYSSKPLDNAQSQPRAEDSQMQESGHTGERPQDDALTVPTGSTSDETALTNGDNNTSADTADQTVRNNHFACSEQTQNNTGNACTAPNIVHLLTCRNRQKMTENAASASQDGNAPAEPAQGDGTEPMADGDAEQAPSAENEDQDAATDEAGNQVAAGTANGMNGFNMQGGNNSFPGMANGMGGDMNQMQMMMAMQNGMMPGNFGFPMMGKSKPLYSSYPENMSVH